MKRRDSIAFWMLLVVLLATPGCADQRWARLATEAATLKQLSAAPEEAGPCDATPERLNDWAFRVQCRDRSVYLRCGYHHGTTCCWPVESAKAATSFFGASDHFIRSVRVCEAAW